MCTNIVMFLISYTIVTYFVLGSFSAIAAQLFWLGGVWIDLLQNGLHLAHSNLMSFTEWVFLIAAWHIASLTWCVLRGILQECGNKHIRRIMGHVPRDCSFFLCCVIFRVYVWCRMGAETHVQIVVGLTLILALKPVVLVRIPKFYRLVETALATCVWLGLANLYYLPCLYVLPILRYVMAVHDVMLHMGVRIALNMLM